MSGFEVAGLVLGAIPLTLELLKHYEDAAKRLSYWRKIELEYSHCEGELGVQALFFKQNLRRLLLPLDMDDIEIDSLLANPSDPMWKNPSVEHRLEERLKDAYPYYVKYMARLEQTIEALKAILAVDSVGVQDHLKKPKDSWTFKGLKTKVRDSEWWGYEKYRIRFANGAKERQRLLEDLDKYNSKLEKLLRTNDEDTRLVTDREGVVSDDKLRSYWDQASRIYNALSKYWDCGCASQESHTVRVLLIPHSESSETFKLVWMKTQPQLCDTSYLEISKTEGLINAFKKMSIHQPGQGTENRLKSAMKGKQAVSGQRLRPPIVKISMAPACDELEIKEVASVCSSLCDLDERGYVGYIEGDESRYYVSQESKARKFPIALEDLIRSQLGQPPSRRQRCRISLAVASSFMQLLETPWLPPRAHRPEIVFVQDDQYYNPELVLEYSSLLSKGTTTTGTLKPASATSQFFGPMEFLGVLLLEFCFWSLLETNPLRASFPAAGTDMERLAFDLAAAQSWRNSVLEHSGLDYKKAVDWCFQGHKDISSTTWRKDMFRNVIQPLEHCYNYLSGHTF
ncbi:hypothetical protein PG989_010246 [Apiospora arundinis]